MKLTLILIGRAIRNWFRSIVPEGWQDERGFHYGWKPENSEK